MRIMKEAYVKEKSRLSLCILLLLVIVSAGCPAALLFWYTHPTVGKYRQTLGDQLEEIENAHQRYVWLLQHEEKVRAKIRNIDVAVNAVYTDDEIVKLLNELSLYVGDSNGSAGHLYSRDALFYLKRYFQSKKILRERLENIRFLSRKLNECRLSTNDDAVRLMLKQQLSLSEYGVLNSKDKNEE